MDTNLLLGAGLVLLVLLALNAGRKVKARTISGIVVMGDVRGNVSQAQGTPASQPAKPKLWRELLSVTNLVLGIAASVLIIASLLIG